MLKTYPNKILRQKSEKVDIKKYKDKDSNVVLGFNDIIEAMTKVIIDFKALGLAACQIGYPFRIIAISPRNIKMPKFMINPKIINKGGTMIGPEACLSFPNVLTTIKRNSFIEVQYYDKNGNKQTEELMGQEAIIVQHECDHLDGITLYQRAPRAERNRIMRKLAIGKRKLAKYQKIQNKVKKQTQELEKFDKEHGETILTKDKEAKRTKT